MTLRVMTIVCVGVLLVRVDAGIDPLSAAPGEGGPGEPRPGSQPVGDGVIVPGQRVGSAKLSMTVDQIVEAVGPRFKRDEFAKEGIILYEWRTEGLWVSQVLATKAIRLISAFGTTDMYHTEKGVALMHPRSRMEQAYGQRYKEYAYPEDKITLVRYHDLGLQFGIVNQPSNPAINGRIFQIGIFRPGDLPPIKTRAQ